VRGLDYYRHTAFEFVTDRLGAQGTVIGGGRYDGLIETLGGPHTPAVGWAAGIERLGMLLEEPTTEISELALIPRGEGAEYLAQEVLALLRAGKVSAEMAYKGSAKTRFEKAKKGLVPRLLDIELTDGQIGSVLIRDINVGATDPEPVRRRIKEALATRFEISDAEADFPRPIHLVRRK
jgi:histidyl-tRNA synthetase